MDAVPQFMASPQCLGYSRYRTVTRDLCFPPKDDILNRTEEAVKKYSAKAVFVATDSDPMLDVLTFRLKGLDVSKQFSWFTTTSCKIVETLLIKHSFSFLKSVLVRNRSDIRDAPSLSILHSHSSQVSNAISWIMDRGPNDVVSQVFLQLVVLSFASVYTARTLCKKKEEKERERQKPRSSNLKI